MSSFRMGKIYINCVCCISFEKKNFIYKIIAKLENAKQIITCYAYNIFVHLVVNTKNYVIYMNNNING